MKRQLDVSDPSEVMQQFHETGRDVLIDILQIASRFEMIADLMEWRTVCKQWKECLREMKHIRLIPNPHSPWYEYFLREHFPMVDSIDGFVSVLGFSTLLCEKIRVLKICDDGDLMSSRAWDISHFTSLTSLTVSEDVGIIGGLGLLTSLTNLECYSEAFQTTSTLFRLTNLEKLSITDVSLHTPLVEALPKLTHLNSNNPLHFIDFTGSGNLETITPHLKYDIGSASPLPLEIRGAIESFWKGAKYLSYKGEWKNGLFSGKFLIKMEVHEKWDTIQGRMCQGKLNGYITMIKSYKHAYNELLNRRVIYHANFLDGVQHGTAIHQEVGFRDRTRREVWENGQRIYSPP